MVVEEQCDENLTFQDKFLQQGIIRIGGNKLSQSE